MGLPSRISISVAETCASDVSGRRVAVADSVQQRLLEHSPFRAKRRLEQWREMCAPRQRGQSQLLQAANDTEAPLAVKALTADSSFITTSMSAAHEDDRLCDHHCVARESSENSLLFCNCASCKRIQSRTKPPSKDESARERVVFMSETERGVRTVFIRRSETHRVCKCVRSTARQPDEGIV